jgi:hypothetical protein
VVPVPLKEDNLEPQVEQTAQADSTDPMDALLDRVMGSDQQEEQPQQTTQEQGGEQAVEQTQGTEQASEIETQPALEEVEWEGQKYQLPPQLKSALMRQQDYTQKTQAVSERERMVALQQQRQQIEQAFQQTVGPEQQALAELEAAIRQYNNVNWQALDTDSLVKTRHALDMLKEQRGELQKRIEGKRGDFEQQMQATHREALQKANEYLSRAIPKWGVEVQKEIMAYGQTEGYTDVELGAIRDPRIIKTLHKAMQWDKLQAGKSIQAKRASGVPPVIKPGAAKPAPSAQVQYADTVKQLHQAKDPSRKKELADKALDLKLDRMFK